MYWLEGDAESKTGDKNAGNILIKIVTAKCENCKALEQCKRFHVGFLDSACHVALACHIASA
jgi:hypothetical protein